MNYQVLPGDSPALIAQRFTGDPRRGIELVMANPYKRRAVFAGGRGVTFQSLRAGEMLTVPSGWTAGWLSGLPRGVGVGKLGLSLSVTDTGAGLLATASGQLTTAQTALANLGQGIGSASDVVTAYNNAIQGFVSAAQQASQAASSAQAAIVAASSQGQGDPAAVQAQTDYNNIQSMISAINTDYSNVSAISDPLTTSPDSAGATDAQTQANNAVSAAQDAVNQATNWTQGGNNPPSPGNIPANVVADAQAVLAAVNASSSYCTDVGVNGTAVNTAVHNFKVDWNAAGLTPQVPVGTGQYEAVTAAAVSTALGGTGPLACGAAPPAPPQTVTCADGSVHPAGYVCPAAPAATATNYTPWLIAAGVVVVAGGAYLLYRNHEGTRNAVNRAGTRVRTHASNARRRLTTRRSRSTAVARRR